MARGLALRGVPSTKFPSLSASGHSGQILHGYQVAYELGPWSITAEPCLPRVYTFLGDVVSRHSHWSKQRPLDMALWIGNVLWSWSDVELAFLDEKHLQFEIKTRPVATQTKGARTL